MNAKNKISSNASILLTCPVVAVFSSIRSTFSQGCLDIIRGILLQCGVIKLPIPDIVWKASHLAILLLDVLILDVREPLF
jgi:hypothetical protein